jgi:UDP-N-acetylmuramyl pentapeptide phosphotransferase/UDP-N-acetylglucosamine-1-phosphate transferase
MLFRLLSLAFGVGFLIIQIYFRVAKRLGIIDKPNDRSSHIEPTLRGGGILFPIMYILVGVWSLYFGEQSITIWFLLGILLIAAISFWDDVSELSPTFRVLVHLIAVGLLLWQTGIFHFDIFAILIAIILIIGSINAYNFMDGINGITALYSMVVVGSLHYLLPEMKLQYLLVSLLVFALFNVRKKAVCFSGDVGSITLAYIIAFCIGKLIVQTQEIKWIFLLGIYGIDSIITILYRLKRKENIFKPHRTHLYQYLANDFGMSHISVSLIYAVAQCILSYLVINNNFLAGLGAFLTATIIYLLVRFKLALD